MDDRTKKMAQEIVKLRFSGITDDLSNGYCHYQAYPLKEKKMSDVDCNSMTCNECRQEWARQKRKEIADEVIKEYGLKEA